MAPATLTNRVKDYFKARMIRRMLARGFARLRGRRRVTIRVTHEDLQMGERKSEDACPIALALRRELPSSEIRVIVCDEAYVKVIESRTGDIEIDEAVEVCDVVAVIDGVGRKLPERLASLALDFDETLHDSDAPAYHWAEFKPVECEVEVA